MDQSPSLEANRLSTGQGIRRILRNSKVYYRIHNSSPPVPVMSQDQSSLCPPTQLPEDPF